MISIAISPCPNDIFNFCQLLTLSSSLSFPYTLHIKPLHELNREAAFGSYDFIKTSFMTYFSNEDRYDLCSVGQSVSHKQGPVIFARENYSLEDLKGLKIATPGEGTVAHFLAKTLFAADTQCFHFREIVEQLKQENIDAGVIIHEARSEFEKHGLHKICDLTQLWYEKYKMPTPLGAFLVRKRTDPKVYDEMMEALTNSRQYAQENRQEVLQLAKKFSQEKSLEALDEHIQNFSVEVNTHGMNFDEVVDSFRRAYQEFK